MLFDILLIPTFWFLLLGGSTVVALAIFVIQQKRKLSDGLSPRIESENATGTKLLFFREIGDGTYLATIWVIVINLPIAPISTWRVFPRSISTHRTARSIVTRYNVTFLEKKPMRLVSVALMYFEVLLHITVIFGPSVLVITLLVVATEWAKTHGNWVLLLVPATAVSGFGYTLFLAWRYNRRYGKGLL